MIEIKIEDGLAIAALNRLAARASNLSPALHDVGEHLLVTTKRRFETGTAPDGSRWAPNSQATLLAHLGSRSGVWDHQGKRVGTRKGYLRQNGRLGAKGVTTIMGKKPLIGESRALGTTINYRVSADSLEIGSAMEYAAMQQFGGSKSKFPHLWGDIPARPFLGLSDEDTAAVVSIVSNYLRSLIQT
ncbi:MAG: phage virion morphogenesis protein [Pseudomonadota bacterium]|nr:phage virion morphogenesis protein [Pseudomonadota bacterium]